MDTVNIVVLITAVGTVCGIVFGYAGFQRGSKKESMEVGQNNGALMSELGYIKSGIDDLKRKQETSEARHYMLADRVTKVEEIARQAHEKISGLLRVDQHD